MKHKRTARKFIAFFIGSIALSILSLSFSLAWYASSANLYVDTLVVSLSSGADLKIATSKNGNYVDKLGYNDLKHVSLFKPVSTMFKSDWMENKHTDVTFYEYQQPTVDNSFRPYEVRSVWGYYSEHLYLKSDVGGTVTIDAPNLIVKPNEKANSIQAEKLHSQYPEYTTTELTERLNTLTRCLRVAILDPDTETYNFSIIEPFKEEPTLLGGRQDLQKTTYYNYYTNYVNNEKYETIYGEIENRELAVYDDVSTEDIVPDGEFTSFNAKTLAGVHPFNLEKSLDNGLTVAVEETYSLNPESPDYLEDNFRLKLKPYQPKEFVLLIYMEGWDVDCINQHMGGNFDVDLEFKIAERG